MELKDVLESMYQEEALFKSNFPIAGKFYSSMIDRITNEFPEFKKQRPSLRRSVNLLEKRFEEKFEKTSKTISEKRKKVVELVRTRSEEVRARRLWPVAGLIGGGLLAISIVFYGYGINGNQNKKSAEPAPIVKTFEREEKNVYKTQEQFENLRQQKMNYFNTRAQEIKKVTENGRVGEASTLISKLKQEIQEAKAQGFY